LSFNDLISQEKVREFDYRRPVATLTTKINSKINQTNTKTPKYNNILPTYTVCSVVHCVPKKDRRHTKQVQSVLL